ncbi:MAG: ribokinase [Anaerolineaceae bacterium]|nr:ribokinase [Anaerolineaceae bacterium]
MNIVFSGSIAFDHLMTFPGYFRDYIMSDNLESLSLSFLTDSKTVHRGGNAPNIAYNHVLLGGKGTVLGTVGQDFHDYRTWLESVGVDTTGIVEIKDEFTASFYATTDRNNAQIASFYSGAMSHSSKLNISNLASRPDLVVISPDDPLAMRYRVQECQSMEIPYLYDPSQQIVRLESNDLYEGIMGAQMIVLNQYEFSLLKEKIHIDETAIVETGAVLVITNGRHGSQIWSGDDYFEIPIFPEKEVCDPTGVGDALRGGFLRAYAVGLPLDMCGRVGALSATYCLEHVGTQNHSYTVSQFVERFLTNYDDEGVIDLFD